jgi:uncharacterized protein YbjT (DUF2867 family)
MGMNCGYPTIDTPASDPKTGCMTNEPILVLGATGKTGRRVVERLQARGVEVRAGSRSSQPPFHWEDASTWAPALEGVSAVYVSYFPDLAVPGAPEAVGALAEQAQRSGVQRVVLLSGRGEEEAQRSERVVAAAGIDWTVVRCSWFNQNFSEGYMLDPILGGELALPAGDVPEPFVDAQDIADVAVAALTEDGHTGEIYELTGPRLLTFAEAVAEIGRATGRELRYVQVSMDEYAAAAAEQDIPDDVAWLIRYLFSEVLDGRNANLADGVQRALGREPRDFADFAREAAAAAVWDV